MIYLYRELTNHKAKFKSAVGGNICCHSWVNLTIVSVYFDLEKASNAICKHGIKHFEKNLCM